MASISTAQLSAVLDEARDEALTETGATSAFAGVFRTNVNARLAELPGLASDYGRSLAVAVAVDGIIQSVTG